MSRHLRRVLTVAALALLATVPVEAFGFSWGSYCPSNRQRPYRQSTRFIILHTTEGPRDGSLRKLWANGESNFLVDRSGGVTKIVNHRRAACHCGRSMWEGRENIDSCSVGIEVVGYHGGDITPTQAAALKKPISELQRIYGVPDGRVLTHSMVAYGEPNRWFRRAHRGRKRCGMLFARAPMRARLGLYDQPRSDPDVRAGRLTVGDTYLAGVLYGSPRSSSGAAAAYAMHQRGPVPRGTASTAHATAARPTAGPAGGLRQIGIHGRNAREIAGAALGSKTTIYFLPDGRVRRGDELSSAALSALPQKTRLLVGYMSGGCVSAGRSPSEICGNRWKESSTLYRFPDGSIRRGDGVREGGIPARAMVFWPV